MDEVAVIKERYKTQVKQFEGGFLEGEIFSIYENLMGVSVVDNLFVTAVSRDDNDRAMLLVQCLAVGILDLVRSSYFITGGGGPSIEGWEPNRAFSFWLALDLLKEPEIHWESSPADVKALSEKVRLAELIAYALEGSGKYQEERNKTGLASTALTGFVPTNLAKDNAYPLLPIGASECQGIGSTSAQVSLQLSSRRGLVRGDRDSFG
ncbi:hypothetical protein ETB97_012121 [Aspergillus alliaceus]|uniref:Uncharacterized protein n=1 Tax=Petromyces alliaceus TaxID=209559 RepID=A0A8H6A5D9_PETAA|nr:hypothetical protein ETB97_012121 [Aspergillus burnettii]